MTTLPEQLRDEALANAEQAADPRLSLAVDKVIAEYAATQMPFSANDIRDSLPVVAAPLVAARIRAAYMRKPPDIRAVGYTRSSLPSTHAKPLVVWVGT